MTKRKILFISPYPNASTIKEGMHQRIKAIDELFVDEERIYLDLDLKKYLVPQKEHISARAVCYHLNFFLYLPYIYFLYLGARLIYCHSIYKFSKIWLFTFFSHKKIVLDIHGVVTEELKAEGKGDFTVSFYNYLEKRAFETISLAVSVSGQMERHFKAKYPLYPGRHYIYAIVPGNLKKTDSENLGSVIDNELAITAEDVVFVYSGNMQVWQNIDLMLYMIRNSRDSAKYILLSGEEEMIRKKLEKDGLTGNNIFVRSVPPERLAYYYEKAHYGFILRDDILINQVANPTKLIEYLSFGIVPVVKSVNIGDFSNYGCEYIHHDALPALLKPIKSEKNRNIARNIMNNHRPDIFKEAILLN